MRRIAASRRLLSWHRLSSCGFTLLELLIALTIGLVVLAAALAVYASSSRSSQLSQVETQLNEDGILALNLIQQQLKVAGYSRQIIPGNGAKVMGNYAGLAVRGCDGGFVNAGAAFDSLACARNSNGTASDAIAIRYEATSENTNAVGTPALPSNCVNGGINRLATPQVSPPPSPAPANYALADNRYMVTNATTQPMLSCRGTESYGKTVNVIGTSQPLLANVENIQMLYGVASRPSDELAATYDPMLHQIVGYLSASEIDALTSTNTLPNLTDDRWGRVLSVRVCLVMRSEQTVGDVPAGGFAYKNCTNVDALGADGYLRKTYTTTVLLRNRVITP